MSASFLGFMFTIWDKDKNGVIDIKEWTTKMREITNLPTSDLERLWYTVDIDNDGLLNEKEFVLLQKKLLDMKKKKIDKLMFLWQCFDLDGDGILSSDEFYQMILRMDMSPRESDMLARRLNTASSAKGKIGFEEFRTVFQEHISDEI